MTVEEFEEFMQKSQFEMAVHLMSKEEFMRWGEKYYDDYHAIRRIIDDLR